MFTRRKEELAILKKSLESLENSQKNTEIMVSAVANMVESQTGKELMLKEEMTEENKRMAAYALNLCTVSVSQIIDYNDENILEQEYETILNNLNLENMPKDEPLLNILKQILDTVAFFRIQEGDRSFIEKEYQNKVKNAIWEAVPDFGVIVAGGNLFTAGISLASQVGIGYMNYRKAKAENALKREEAEWQLQRAAIEQLNGLRRELFDASWRLADRYGFKDEYRLTERQITQYNKILMDADDYRRYERLEAIQQYFEAYPSFWYHLGHAANLIAQKAQEDNNGMLCNKFKSQAMMHFQKFIDADKYSLLREDQITSSCALEYIDLLLSIEQNDGEIKKLLDLAKNMSGQACDILQICAIDYLRINDSEAAKSILKSLVNENYNAVMNAQLLSCIYVNEIKENDEKKYEDMSTEYEILTKTVPADLLFPFPESIKEINIPERKKDFYEKRKVELRKKYEDVVRNYIEKCTVMFNKSIPLPCKNKTYPDSFYSDSCGERLEQYKKIFEDNNKVDEYLSRLANSNFTSLFLNTFNEMLNGIKDILPGDKAEQQNSCDTFAEAIRKKLEINIETIKNIQIGKKKDFNFNEFETCFNFVEYTDAFINELESKIQEYVNSIDTMLKFSQDELRLHEFCIRQEIPDLGIIIDMNQKDKRSIAEETLYFSEDILGEKVTANQTEQTVANSMIKEIDAKKDEIIEESMREKTTFYLKTDSYTKYDFKKYFNKRRYYKKFNVFAVLVDKSAGIPNTDLVFTVKGIICDKCLTSLKTNPSVTDYKDIDFSDENGIILGDNIFYNNKNVDLKKLYDLFNKLADTAEKESTK